MRGTKKGAVAPTRAMEGEVFNGSNYKSTVSGFYGQDKPKSNALGGHPSNVEEELIENLQQQSHFMELELKILKEKVIDDESKSGIGAMFDDDKTSHQHIQLLKVKYR